MTTQADYGYHRTLTGTSMPEARERVTAALAAEGFGILTEIDLSATLRAKLGEEVPPYLILGACNPALAHRALHADPDIGLLLPCNVVLRQLDSQDGCEVAILRPRSMFGLTGAAALEPLAEDADARVRRALERL